MTLTVPQPLHACTVCCSWHCLDELAATSLLNKHLHVLWAHDAALCLELHSPSIFSCNMKLCHWAYARNQVGLYVVVLPIGYRHLLCMSTDLVCDTSQPSSSGSCFEAVHRSLSAWQQPCLALKATGQAVSKQASSWEVFLLGNFQAV